MDQLRLTTQINATQLQAQLDMQSAGVIVDCMPYREYPGPLILDKALIMDGNNATLWALEGPVLTVRAAVHLRNLRIEVTTTTPSSDEAACAIHVAGGDLTLENVEVRGLVQGLRQEKETWHYPHSLVLGGIAPNTAHHWQLSLYVPVDCTVESHIAAMQVTPNQLRAGINHLLLHTAALPRDFLINGHLTLITAVLRRRILVTAYANESPSAQRGQGQIIWAPPPDATAPPIIVQAPIQPQASDITPRLRRNQLPNELFTNTDGSGKHPNPELEPATEPNPVLGTIFLHGDAPLQSHAGPATDSGTPHIAPKPSCGIPTAQLFSNSTNIGLTPAPVTPYQPNPSEGQDTITKGQHRNVSLPADGSGPFKEH